MPVTSHVWHLWPGRHWPALPEEEAQFVDDLTDQVVADPSHVAAGVERQHYTAVLNALRCGLSAAELLTLVPGMAAADLLNAYVRLEQLRLNSLHAWREIIDEPTVACLAEHGPVASALLPVPMTRLVTAATNARAEGSLIGTVRAIELTIDTHARAAADLEDLLARRTPPDPVGVEIGTKLHHPHVPALWGAPYFLPGRVTALSPVRVADLLGERPLTPLKVA